MCIGTSWRSGSGGCEFSLRVAGGLARRSVSRSIDAAAERRASPPATRKKETLRRYRISGLHFGPIDRGLIRESVRRSAWQLQQILIRIQQIARDMVPGEM